MDAYCDDDRDEWDDYLDEWVACWEKVPVALIEGGPAERYSLHLYCCAQTGFLRDDFLSGWGARRFESEMFDGPITGIRSPHLELVQTHWCEERKYAYVGIITAFGGAGSALCRRDRASAIDLLINTARGELLGLVRKSHSGLTCEHLLSVEEVLPEREDPIAQLASGDGWTDGSCHLALSE